MPTTPVGQSKYTIELSGEKFDIADLPEEKVQTVAGIWSDQLLQLLPQWEHF